ncbi:endo-1,4-beta-xylanase 5-like [Diospyros lotus]|uniref:endo-1,4-beta-xylanase 5-like n=1 Tax=Diospyros lotus TaxID=55363 RepID=UPI00225A03D0|nr:endo-1,4-beta-xylanase 5-like [Diospyros lotus]
MAREKGKSLLSLLFFFVAVVSCLGLYSLNYQNLGTAFSFGMKWRGAAVDGLLYDYSYTLECLANPEKPQYGGGVVVNPELNHGLKGWTAKGNARIEQRESQNGSHNMFIVVSSRRHPDDSFSQKLYLDKDKLYTLSAWLQVSEGSAKIAAVLKTPSGFDQRAGWVVAESGCWSMLKGGLSVNVSGPGLLYFESNDTKAEIWADSISLQPFTKQQWRSHRRQSIDKARKGVVKLRAVDAAGRPLANATVAVTESRPYFPFGAAMSHEILTNAAYQYWFTSRFKLTTFENEMKWSSTEPSQGHEDYSVADAMLGFAKQHGIAVRGHNVLWSDPSYLAQWVKSLSPYSLRLAVDKRIRSLVSRYASQVIAWDVENENLHFNFFESRLGENASPGFFKLVNQIDGQTTLFLNDFNTVEDMNDPDSNPGKYLKKIREIRAGGYAGPLAIGLEGHFTGAPNLAYMRASIDKLAATGLPIWLTEVDVSNVPNQAEYFEEVLREGHAHPKVNGIVMWVAMSQGSCYRMCLTNNNFENLATGDVVDKLLKEWGGAAAGASSGKTDAQGHFQTKLFHGDYWVSVQHPTKTDSSVAKRFKVAPKAEEESQEETVRVIKVSA